MKTRAIQHWFSNKTPQKRPPLNKRRKINVKRAPKVERKPEPHVESVVSLQPLLDLVEWHDAEEPGPSFELLMDALLPEFLHDREEAQVRESEIDVYVCICASNRHAGLTEMRLSNQRASLCVH